MAKEFIIDDKNLMEVIEDFNKLYDLKTVILLGRESGCRRIEMSED